MKIICLRLGQLETNCYLIFNPKTNNCLIIDPADEANFISEKIISQKLIPRLIIATHGHFDHILAAGELQRTFQIPLAINYNDLFLLKNTLKSSQYWLGQEIFFLPPQPTIDLRREKTILLDKTKIQIIKTPGHTPGSICLYLPKAKTLFSGDTLFLREKARIDFTYSDKKEYQKSLAKLEKLLPLQLYPGHGPSGFKA